jgi:hypothetical protein
MELTGVKAPVHFLELMHIVLLGMGLYWLLEEEALVG